MLVVHIPIDLRRGVGRGRLRKRQPQEEGPGRVALLDELGPFAGRPIGRVQMLGQMRGPRHPAIPVDAVVPVTVGALFVFVKVLVVIADKPRISPPALVEYHVVKTVEPPLRRVVRLADQLGVVARLGQLSWQRRRVFERIAAGHGQPPVVPLVHPRDNPRSRRRTGGHRSIGVREIRPLLG